MASSPRCSFLSKSYLRFLKIFLGPGSPKPSLLRLKYARTLVTSPQITLHTPLVGKGSSEMFNFKAFNVQVQAV